MIESSRLLVDEANATTGRPPTLIDQAGPFLDAQIRGGDDIKSLADGLARLTGEVANADPQLRTTLQTVPGAAEAANETFSRHSAVVPGTRGQPRELRSHRRDLQQVA